jgi:hypothetical protein
MTATRCDTCRWWRPLLDQKGQPSRDHGRCHRRAPAVAILTEDDESDGNVWAWWPQTVLDDFCGEHAPKEGK